MTPIQISENSTYIPDILNLLKEAFAFMEDRIDPPSSLNALTVEKIAEQCRSGEVWSIGRPPKACVFLTIKKDALYLGRLAVCADVRGQGLARKLIALAEERAAELKLPHLELETRVELRENHETFARLGFVKLGEGAHEGFDRPTYIIMRKQV